MWLISNAAQVREGSAKASADQQLRHVFIPDMWQLSLPCAALDIDHCDLECQYNNVEHRTDLNGVERLIVRRGQAFSIKLYLRSGSYQPGVSALDCVAETGAPPSALKSVNSGAVVLISMKRRWEKWPLEWLTVRNDPAVSLFSAAFCDWNNVRGKL